MQTETSADVSWPCEIHSAIASDDVERLKEFLERYPHFDLARQKFFNGTALEWAIRCHSLQVTQFLLLHPAIDPNGESPHESPLFLAYSLSALRFLELLLSDPRVRVNDHVVTHGILHLAVNSGPLEAVQTLLASGRDFVIEDDLLLTNLQLVRSSVSRCGDGRAELIRSYVADPALTALRCRFSLGRPRAALIFAMIVFLCDDFVTIGLDAEKCPFGRCASHFFFIASRLPMELQVLISSRVARSSAVVIPHQESELAFRVLAAVLSYPH